MPRACTQRLTLESFESRSILCWHDSARGMRFFHDLAQSSRANMGPSKIAKRSFQPFRGWALMFSTFRRFIQLATPFAKGKMALLLHRLMMREAHGESALRKVGINPF